MVLLKNGQTVTFKKYLDILIGLHEQRSPQMNCIQTGNDLNTVAKPIQF